MSEGGSGTQLPVIFFDGEREFPIGHVRIFPTQVYKTFLYIVSQQIRISPSQISIFLVNRNNLTKILLSNKTSFSRVCAERDCFLLVILKRSRSRKPSPESRIAYPESYPVPGDYESHPGSDDYEVGRIPYPESYSLPGDYGFVPQNVTLLRRHHHLPVEMNYSSQFHDQIAQQYLNPYGLVNYSPDEGFPRIEEAFPKMIIDKPILKYCAECTFAEKNGKVADFHHCVNDEVVKEIRPCRFGPIGPSLR